MVNKKIWLGMLVMVFGMAVVGCDNGTTSGGGTTNNGGNNNGGGGNNGGGNENPFVGTWVGTVQGAQATITINVGTWSLSVPAVNFSDSGTYSGSGSVATLTSNNGGGEIVGTATANIMVGGEISITLVLNNNSAAPGRYILTKQ